MKFEEVHERFGRGRLSACEAAEWLGCSERTFRRMRMRYDSEGPRGLLDRRIGKTSPHRIPADEVERIVALYRDRYAGWTVKHFWERAREQHGLLLSYGWTKMALYGAGALRPAPKRSAHRKKRPRRPLPGMLLHQDGSRHAWIPGLDREFDLIATLDDATSELYSAFLVEEENTASSFRALHDVIIGKGLFCALYTDRASHYFFTPKAGEKVSKSQLTQVGRALRQLGIQHIPAYSPQARGRGERLFGTLQGRLPKELADAGITTIDAANAYLAEVYVPAHNKRFAVAAAEPGLAFVPWSGGDLAQILCQQEDRCVGNDNTVRFDGLILQIPPSPIRHHFVRAKVQVRRYHDGRLALYHGPRRIAAYDDAGALIEDPHARAA